MHWTCFFEKANSPFPHKHNSENSIRKTISKLFELSIFVQDHQIVSWGLIETPTPSPVVIYVLVKTLLSLHTWNDRYY